MPAASSACCSESELEGETELTFELRIRAARRRDEARRARGPARTEQLRVGADEREVPAHAQHRCDAVVEWKTEPAAQARREFRFRVVAAVLRIEPRRADREGEVRLVPRFVIEQQRAAKVEIVGVDLDAVDRRVRRVEARLLAAVEQLVERARVTVKADIDTVARVAFEIDALRRILACVDLEVAARTIADERRDLEARPLGLRSDRRQSPRQDGARPQSTLHPTHLITPQARKRRPPLLRALVIVRPSGVAGARTYPAGLRPTVAASLRTMNRQPR